MGLQCFLFSLNFFHDIFFSKMALPINFNKNGCLQMFHSQNCYNGRPEVYKQFLNVVFIDLQEQSDLKPVRTTLVILPTSACVTLKASLNRQYLCGKCLKPLTIQYLHPVQTRTKTKH